MNKAQCNRCYRKNRDCREHIVYNDDYCPSFFYKINLEKKSEKSADPLILKEPENKAKEQKSNSSNKGILSFRNVGVMLLIIAVAIFALYFLNVGKSASSSSVGLLGFDKSSSVVQFNVPTGFTKETRVFPNSGLSFQELELSDVCRLAIFTDVYTASSITKLNEACHQWGSQYSLDYSLEKLSEEKRIINGNRCLYIINRCDYDHTSLFWRQVLIIDKESTRISLVSCYDQGDDSYLLSILNSFSFS